MNLIRIKINKLINVRKNISKWSGDSEEESKDSENRMQTKLNKKLREKPDEQIRRKASGLEVNVDGL